MKGQKKKLLKIGAVRLLFKALKTNSHAKAQSRQGVKVRRGRLTQRLKAAKGEMRKAFFLASWRLFVRLTYVPVGQPTAQVGFFCQMRGIISAKGLYAFDIPNRHVFGQHNTRQSTVVLQRPLHIPAKRFRIDQEPAGGKVPCLGA